MPINKDILKIVGDTSKHGDNDPEPGLVDKLLREWSKRNSIKILIAAITWGLGAVALLLA